MTGLVRKATLLSACGLLAACTAMAGVPDPTKSTVGTSINLGGNTGGVVDVRVEKLMTIRDAGNNPIANSTVVITFTTCLNNDIRLCTTQPNHPGALFNCPARTVTAVTNASGVATFRIAGNATNPGGNTAGVGAGCAVVRADGVLVGNLPVGAFEENGTGGVSVADFGALLGDRFGAYRGRSDYNGDGAVTVTDLSAWLAVRFNPPAGPSGSQLSCPGATVCP